jgi:hypothetical protein
MNFEDMFSDSTEMLDDLDRYSLARYFIETRKNADRKSTLSWLSVIDLDTLQLISQYGEIIRNNEECGQKNMTEDIFDQPMLEIVDEDGFLEINRAKNKVAGEKEELTALIIILLAWEHNQRAVPVEVIEEATYRLVLYSSIEILRREGYLQVAGNGTLLSENVKFKATTKGRKLGKKMWKALDKIGSSTML